MKERLKQDCEDVLEMLRKKDNSGQKVMDFDNPPKVKLPDNPSPYEYRDLLDEIRARAVDKKWGA